MQEDMNTNARKKTDNKKKILKSPSIIPEVIIKRIR